MRILFFGTAEFAIPSLEALAASGRHDIQGVVTQPDRPQGRGLQVSVSPVKRAAERLGLAVLQPRRVRAETFLQQARDINPDALALAAFGQIIPQALLDLPPFGPINVHGSLLPAYRGASPIQYAILNGEAETGVTTMWMDATLDTGDILLRRAVPIDPEDTTGTLTPKLAELGGELLLETLERLEAGTCHRTPQDHSLATYAPPIGPEDSAIDWSEPAGRIRNRIRALSPRPGAFTLLNGRRLKLWRAEVQGEIGKTGRESLRNGSGVESEIHGLPGTVLEVGREAVWMSTGGGALGLMEVQPDNGRRMAAPDWARGARVKPGDRCDPVDP
jgi:methionyl-tRNA formyltransferase